MSKRYWLIALFVASAAAAQENPLAVADSMFATCLAAAEREDDKAARTAADRAFELYGAYTNRRETAVRALVGQARVISQCRIPFASFMRQGALVEESTELLQHALQIDSMSFGARFTLAMNYFRTPAFLGKTDDALKQFEWLVAHYGQRTDIGTVAEVYAYLGDLYDRQKKSDRALSTWQRGLELFPSSELLKARVQKSAPDAPPPAYALKPIVVEGGSYSMEDPRSATSLKRLDVYTAPGGAADMLQVFQMMPGATRATDGSDLYVRGGDPTESPVFVDGARLFYPGTFESLNGSVFGVLDPAVLKQAYFSAGGFSARYGNALSGVLDVETEGRADATNWRAGVNLAGAHATLYAPVGEKSGLMLSTNGTETSAMLALHGRGAKYHSAPRAGQGLASFVYAPREGTEFRAVGLSEADRMEIDVESHGYSGELRANGATRVAALAGRWVAPDAKRGMRGTLAFSQRTTGFHFGVLDRDRNDHSFSLRFDADFAPATGIRMRAGTEAAHLVVAERGMLPATEDLTPGAPVEQRADDRTTRHIGGYVEGEFRIARDLALITGARVDRLPGEDGVSFDPRAAVAYRAGDWTLRAGGGLYHQGRWRVRYRVPDAGLPGGIPTSARHIAVGAQRDGSLPVRVEAFLKSYDDYVADGAGPQVATGRSLGVDALLRWTALDRLSGWLSYSLLDATVVLGDGERVRAPNDVTHTFTGVAKVSLTDYWDFGTTLRLGTGRPFTPIVGATEIEDGRGYRATYGAIDADRLPTYFRVDGRLMHLRPAAGRLLVFYIEALNLLDHRNVLAYTYDRTYQQRRGVESFFSDRTFVVGVEAQF